MPYFAKSPLEMSNAFFERWCDESLGRVGRIDGTVVIGHLQPTGEDASADPQELRTIIVGKQTSVARPSHPPRTIRGMTTIDERSDFLNALDKHRGFLRQTLNGVTDEEAGRRTTVSELCLGGIVKHVTRVELGWVDFIEQGPAAIGGGFDAAAVQAHLDTFRMLEGETVAELLARYDEAAAHTAEVVHGLPSLDVAHPLPEAPWFEQGASWSARRVLLHILAESAQHAGHADIIREALDGAKTMG